MPETLQLKGLGKKKTVAFMEEARRSGMTPQQYLKYLVEKDLSIAERARTTTFEELLGPGEKASIMKPRSALSTPARNGSPTPANPPPSMIACG